MSIEQLGDELQIDGFKRMNSRVVFSVPTELGKLDFDGRLSGTRLIGHVTQASRPDHPLPFMFEE